MAMMTRILPLLLLIPFAACTSTYVEDVASEEFAPVYPSEALPEQAALPTGGFIRPHLPGCSRRIGGRRMSAIS